MSLDIVSAHGAGGGTIFYNGAGFDVVVAPPNVYLKADSASWTKLTGSSTAGELFAGKWLRTTTEDADFSSFAQLFDTSTFTTSSSTSSTLTKGPVTKFRGKQAIPIREAETAEAGSVIYVAAKGTPVVLGIVGSGANKGQVIFSRYGSAKPPGAPANAIDLSALEQAAG